MGMVTCTTHIEIRERIGPSLWHNAQSEMLHVQLRPVVPLLVEFGSKFHLSFKSNRLDLKSYLMIKY